MFDPLVAKLSFKSGTAATTKKQVKKENQT
jgi:hypothetical protein